MSKIIDLKGSILSLTVLKLKSNSISETKKAIEKKVAKMPSFFSGIPVVLEPHVPLDDATFLALLVDHLRQLEMIPIGIRTDDPAIAEQAQYAGLAVFPIETKKKKSADKATESAVKDAKETSDRPELTMAKTIRGSVRSGQQIYAKNQDLIILGSVNPGAEVLSDGNVHVFGKVMGKVFAGASGEVSAKIFAKQIKPELVCIAGAYQLDEDISDDYKQGFIEISLKNDSLVFNTNILD